MSKYFFGKKIAGVIAIIFLLFGAVSAYSLDQASQKEELDLQFAPEPNSVGNEKKIDDGNIRAAKTAIDLKTDNIKPKEIKLIDKVQKDNKILPPKPASMPIVVKEPVALKPDNKVSQGKSVAMVSNADKKVIKSEIKRSSDKWSGVEAGLQAMGEYKSYEPQSTYGLTAPQVYSLKECIDIAKANHLPLQTADKSIKLAKSRVMEASRNMLPSITIAFEPYTGKVNGRYYDGRKQYIEGKQPLFRGGELLYALRQAQTNLEITKCEKDKIENDLILQVKKGYYAFRRAKSNLKLQEELLKEAERINKMVSEQFNAKLISNLELLNVNSQASQIKYQYASADGDVSISELILKQAMNIDPSLRIDIVSKTEFIKPKISYELALSSAMVNRPEMKINNLMIDYYLYGKRIATAKGLPKVDLMGTWGLAKEEYIPKDNAFGDTGWGTANNVAVLPDQKLQEQWYAGFKTSLPIWGSTAEYSYTREQWAPVVSAYQGTEATTNSFKLKILDDLAMFSEKQLSEIDFDRARQELIKTRQDVTLEVKEQCFNYEKALIQLDTAESKVKYQSNDLEFMKMKRGLDEATDADVVESMIKLSQEKFGLVQAVTDCHISVASINKAIGIPDYYKDEE